MFVVEASWRVLMKLSRKDHRPFRTSAEYGQSNVNRCETSTAPQHLFFLPVKLYRHTSHHFDHTSKDFATPIQWVAAATRCQASKYIRERHSRWLLSSHPPRKAFKTQLTSCKHRRSKQGANGVFIRYMGWWGALGTHLLALP